MKTERNSEEFSKPLRRREVIGEVSSDVNGGISGGVSGGITETVAGEWRAW